MTTEELNRLKSTELDVLSNFDQYCKENDLKYYLIGGALLGSARYGGFIPWDDDIDVAMPRDDYEKIKRLWYEKSIGGYFLQHAGSDPKFARCIMKLRKNGTKLVEQTTDEIKMHQGIYIDIFPIDYISDNSKVKVARRAKAIRRLMTLRTIKSGYKGNHKKIKDLIRLSLFWLPTGIIDKRIYKLCTLENENSRKYAILYLHNYSWDRQIHSVDVFGNGSTCMFEGKKFAAPEKVEDFLTKVFGQDYMLEPPLEKRVNPHRYKSVAFNVADGD